jgi:hypothetical protein
MDAMVDDCGLCVDEVRALQVFLSLPYVKNTDKYIADTSTSSVNAFMSSSTIMGAQGAGRGQRILARHLRVKHAACIKHQRGSQAPSNDNNNKSTNAPANAKRTMAERRTVTASNTDATQKPRSNRTKK